MFFNSLIGGRPSYLGARISGSLIWTFSSYDSIPSDSTNYNLYFGSTNTIFSSFSAFFSFSFSYLDLSFLCFLSAFILSFSVYLSLFAPSISWYYSFSSISFAFSALLPFVKASQILVASSMHLRYVYCLIKSSLTSDLRRTLDWSESSSYSNSWSILVNSFS